MLKRCGLSLIGLFILTIFISFVFAAGGTHTASEIKGGTFGETVPYNV